jgi:hypothetical protein
MPSTFTMYARRQLLKSMFTPDDFLALESVEVALTRSIPPANAAADQLIEPDADSYSRQVYPVGVVYWAPTNFGELYNTLTVQWEQIASQEWGFMRGWAVLDPVSGQCLNVGSIIRPFRGITGMEPKLEPGTLMLGLYD